MIYLDYAASAPLRAEVRQSMMEAFDLAWANPGSSMHLPGAEAAAFIAEKRSDLAQALAVDPSDLIFTASATEAINLALIGSMQYCEGKHFICMRSDHAATLACAKVFEGKGLRVSYLEVDSQGVIDLAQLQALLDSGADLLSILWVNNETGSVQPLAEIAERCAAAGVLLHVDAVQAPITEKIEINANISAMTFSAHKYGGPKGVGLLYRRARHPVLRLSPIIHGGGQEKGLRGGTEAAHQIAGLSTALCLAMDEQPKELKRLAQLRSQIVDFFANKDGVVLNSPIDGAAHIINLSFRDVVGESLLVGLPELALASGSACASNSLEASHVLKAMGVSNQLAQSAMRISIGRQSDALELERACVLIWNEYTRLRAHAHGL